VATPTKLMTFAEFEQLTEPEGIRYELHDGELVEMPFPKLNHYLIQRRFRVLLEPAVGARGLIDIEFGFRALPDREYRRADVAFVSQARVEGTDKTGYFSGAPDLVVEVLSPSNTVAEMRAKRKVCLENGSREFWVVDLDEREVEVWTPDGRSVTYKSGQQIPLFFAPGADLPVDAIFTG
jgi:Uma2 family endonuclease